MAKKVLMLVEVAYRATLEEQDDTVIWLTHAMKANGGDADVLLQGNAVNYGIRGQDASGLRIGAWRQKCPPQIAEDLASLLEKGAGVHMVREDLTARGLREADLIAGRRFAAPVRAVRPGLALVGKAQTRPGCAP